MKKSWDQMLNEHFNNKVTNTKSFFLNKEELIIGAILIGAFVIFLFVAWIIMGGMFN